MNLFGRRICQQNNPFYVAEISCNHNGSLEQAQKLIFAAKESMADAVKIQCYEPSDMTLETGLYEKENDFIVKKGLWKQQHLWDLYCETMTKREYIKPMFDYANSINMPIFSSVFSADSLCFLENVGCQVYKISAFELNDTSLIRKVAKTGKSIIMSVGATAPIEHVERALEITSPINTALLHCVSAYPTREDQANLYRIEVLRSFYGVPVGFSDHTCSNHAAKAAVAMGARIIEKHLTLPGLNTEDGEFSVTPFEFKSLVVGCNQIISMINKSREDPELDTKQFKRSLYIVKDIKEGEAFTLENIRSIRPGYGLDPDKLYQVITKRAKTDLKRGAALLEEHVN